MKIPTPWRRKWGGYPFFADFLQKTYQRFIIKVFYFYVVSKLKSKENSKFLKFRDVVYAFLTYIAFPKGNAVVTGTANRTITVYMFHTRQMIYASCVLNMCLFHLTISFPMFSLASLDISSIFNSQ